MERTRVLFTQGSLLDLLSLSVGTMYPHMPNPRYRGLSTQCHLIQGTWASLGFRIHGDPGTNALQMRGIIVCVSVVGKHDYEQGILAHDEVF